MKVFIRLMGKVSSERGLRLAIAAIVVDSPQARRLVEHGVGAMERLSGIDPYTDVEQASGRGLGTESATHVVICTGVLLLKNYSLFHCQYYLRECG